MQRESRWRRRRPGGRKAVSTYLKEPLQPPNLEDPLPDQHAQLKDTPPLDPRIRALRRVPMHPLPDDDVTLLILDLGQQIAQLPHLLVQRVGGGFGFGHVDDAVHVEGHFFAVGRPVLVAEAVRVFPVRRGGEGVVAGRHGALVHLVRVARVLDLNEAVGTDGHSVSPACLPTSPSC